MLIRLLRDSRITHKAGEVINVTSPEIVHFLVSVGSAETISADKDKNDQPERQKRGPGRKPKQ